VPVDLWLVWFEMTHRAGEMGGVQQWCTLDGRSQLEQYCVVKEAFGLISEAVGKAMAQQRRNNGGK